jgi:hypothetical protein
MMMRWLERALGLTSELSVRRRSSSFQIVSRVRRLVEIGSLRMGEEDNPKDNKSARCQGGHGGPTRAKDLQA